ncbi:MAG: hypothetical protein M1819_000443 [Sarea resinae]|nr:MAG: hypothetical protein M1819_000443 [Sarea resinae]
MVQITSAFVASLAFLGSASATRLYANSGCILANGLKICQGDEGQIIDGSVDILACVNRNASPETANCELQTSIPDTWDDAYFGADNCLYSAGSPGKSFS